MTTKLVAQTLSPLCNTHPGISTYLTSAMRSDLGFGKGRVCTYSMPTREPHSKGEGAQFGTLVGLTHLFGGYTGGRHRACRVCCFERTVRIIRETPAGLLLERESTFQWIFHFLRLDPTPPETEKECFNSLSPRSSLATSIGSALSGTPHYKMFARTYLTVSMTRRGLVESLCSPGIVKGRIAGEIQATASPGSTTGTSTIHGIRKGKATASPGSTTGTSTIHAILQAKSSTTATSTIHAILQAKRSTTATTTIHYGILQEATALIRVQPLNGFLSIGNTIQCYSSKRKGEVNKHKGVASEVSEVHTHTVGQVNTHFVGEVNKHLGVASSMETHTVGQTSEVNTHTHTVGQASEVHTHTVGEAPHIHVLDTIMDKTPKRKEAKDLTSKEDKDLTIFEAKDLTSKEAKGLTKEMLEGSKKMAEGIKQIEDEGKKASRGKKRTGSPRAKKLAEKNSLVVKIYTLSTGRKKHALTKLKVANCSNRLGHDLVGTPGSNLTCLSCGLSLTPGPAKTISVSNPWIQNSGSNKPPTEVSEGMPPSTSGSLEPEPTKESNRDMPPSTSGSNEPGPGRKRGTQRSATDLPPPGSLEPEPTKESNRDMKGSSEPYSTQFLPSDTTVPSDPASNSSAASLPSNSSAASLPSNSSSEPDREPLAPQSSINDATPSQSVTKRSSTYFAEVMEKTQSIFRKLAIWHYLLMGLPSIGLMARFWANPIHTHESVNYLIETIMAVPLNSHLSLSVVITLVIALIASAGKFQHPLLQRAGKFVILGIVLFPSIYLLLEILYPLISGRFQDGPLVDSEKGLMNSPEVPPTGVQDTTMPVPWYKDLNRHNKHNRYY